MLLRDSPQPADLNPRPRDRWSSALTTRPPRHPKCLHTTWKTWKTGVTQCNEMTILTDSFVPLHALLFWLRIEVVDAFFIPNNELWYKFLLGHVGIFWEVLQKFVHSLVLTFSTPIWQTLCSCHYAKMYKIFIAQKSYCACHVLALLLQEANNILILFWRELGQAENFLIAPRN